MVGKIPAFFATSISAVLLFAATADSRLAFLAWIAFIPLLWLLEKYPPRLCFGAGWLGGSLFFILLLHWLAIPVWNFGGTYKYPGLIGLILVLILMGISWGLFTYLARKISENFAFNALLFLPFLWTSIELLRVFIFPPLPLGIAGYSQAPYPELIQGASIFGVAGISFLIVFFNVGLWLLIKGDYHRIPLTLVLILIMGGNAFFGYFVLQKPQEEIMEVGLVQGNIPQEEKWDYQRREENLQAHLQPSKQMDGEVDLILWPETSIPTTRLGNNVSWRQMENNFEPLTTPVLAGILAPVNGMVHNTALLLEEGQVLMRYDKNWLVPFGEYVPLSGILGWVDTGFIPTKAGDEKKIFSYENWNWATPICYEILNQGLIRRMSREGEILFNQSNEAWFEDSIGLPVLWNVGILRAVEVRRPVVKAANTGYSGWVDDLGRTRELFPHLQHHYEEITVESTNLTSIYRDWGNLPLFLFLGGTFVLSFLIGPRRRKKLDFKKYAWR